MNAVGNGPPVHEDNGWSVATCAQLSAPAAHAALVVAWRTDATVWKTDVLLPDERARAQRLPARKGAAWSQARAGLRTVLAQVLGQPALGLEFVPNAHGKPAVAGIEFNLSHSGAWAVLGLATTPFGIDLETRLVRDPVALAQRFCTPREMIALSALPAPEQAAYFRRLWTAREAAVKALGRSLLISGPTFSVDMEACRCVAESDAGRDFSTLTLSPLPDLDGAAVTLASPPMLRVVRCVQV